MWILNVHLSFFLKITSKMWERMDMTSSQDDVQRAKVFVHSYNFKLTNHSEVVCIQYNFSSTIWRLNKHIWKYILFLPLAVIKCSLFCYQNGPFLLHFFKKTKTISRSVMSRNILNNIKLWIFCLRNYKENKVREHFTKYKWSMSNYVI